MGRSWVPDFVFPEAGFWPLAGAAEDGEAGAVLLAAMRGWDSADPSALLRLVLLVIDRRATCRLWAPTHVCSQRQVLSLDGQSWRPR